MRVASLFLPRLPIERLRRQGPPASAPPERDPPLLPVDDDPGACSVPRGGVWRPGARWARAEAGRREVEAQAAMLPSHQRPSIRELGRRSEAAAHPFRDPRSRLDAAAATAPGGGVVDRGVPPLVLHAVVGRRQEVVAACDAALAVGIVPGMALTHARVLLPGLEVRPAEPAADAALLGRLALHAIRHWTPVAAPSGEDGLWLDMTGVSHLFGGEGQFARRLVAFCERIGLTARVAVADTPGCAHAVARFGRRAIEIVDPGWTVEAIEALPIAALRLDRTALTAARRFGLERIEDMRRLPRAPLARRLGLAAVRRLDQATGAEPEPIAPVVDESAPTAELRLLEPIGLPEQIDVVAGDLAAALADALRRRGLGARSVRLHASRVDGADQWIAIGTSASTRDPAHLLRLLRLRLDSIDPGLGLETFRLVAERCERLDASAIVTLVDERGGCDVAGLVDVLAGRVGVGSVFRAAPIESHVPERAVVRCEPAREVGGWPSWSRPARLLARPERLHAVMALLPDQPPRRFSWRGRDYRVESADGPERVHGEWWVREAETWAVRDYFRVEDQDGGRWWLFRRGDGADGSTGDLSWWMHGAG